MPGLIMQYGWHIRHQTIVPQISCVVHSRPCIVVTRSFLKIVSFEEKINLAWGQWKIQDFNDVDIFMSKSDHAGISNGFTYRVFLIHQISTIL
jgi:hypothetical protein